MKTNFFFFLFLQLFILSSVCRSQSGTSKAPIEWNTILENQKTPLVNSNEELVMVNDIAWQRCYGEKEYILTPRIQNIQNYLSRIKSLDVPSHGKLKSTFHFAKIVISNAGLSILKSANIEVPSYVGNEVMVMLPEIDLDNLTSAGVVVTYLDNYGTQKAPTEFMAQKSQNTSAVIFNEDFETATIPGAVYSSTILGAANCGWKDVSCYKHAGSWSVWCAGNGPACNSCLNDYVNDMDSEFWKTASLNTSQYQNMTFTWWMDYDFNNTGTNDILYKFWWLSGAWQVSPTSYNSSSPLDGLLWNQHTATFAGIQTSFSYDFKFVSNGNGTQYGVYVDDIQLTGTPLATGINQLNQNPINLTIYPNPSSGQLTLRSTSDLKIEILNELGQQIKLVELSASNSHFTVLTELSPGIYFVRATNGNETHHEKVVITR